MARNGPTSARRRRAAAGDAAQPAAAAATAAGATPADGAAQQQQQPSVREALRQVFFRTAIMYVIYQYYWKKPDPAADAKSPAPVAPKSGIIGQLLGNTARAPAYYGKEIIHAWPRGVLLEYRVFTSLDDRMEFRAARSLGKDAAVFGAERVVFDTIDESYSTVNVSLSVPEVVRERNATWYAHVFVALDDLWKMDNPADEQLDRGVLYARHEMITWRKVDLRKEGKNLLGGALEADEEGSAAAEVEQVGEDGEKLLERYDQVWKPTLPIVAVTAQGKVTLSQLPPNAAAAFRVDEEGQLYYPPMHVNEFWMLQDSLHLMNETVKEVIIEMSFSPVGLYKWSMYKQFDAMWQKQIDFGAMQPHETDELKRMFVETNPWLLGTTMIVSTAHTVLETLAFKNDISHWKNIKTMEGVSVRSMIWKIVMEAIIFLYLWDNDTSWMITIGNGVGLAIAVWKVGKAVKFENFGKRKLFGFIPWFDMVDRESYSRKTKEYDDQAMKYLSYALYPLVICYALYSLKYDKHKSWYSWVISSLVGAVYAFGFILMFPQIFINYKLKSVAHMPMKAMMYKTLNTVIDDLFSFIIKMPWLHRLACFRDDVVFLIILYQRWIYPVDTTRVNEFGQQFNEDGEEKAPSGGAGDGREETPETNQDETAEAKEDESDAKVKSEGEKKND